MQDRFTRHGMVQAVFGSFKSADEIAINEKFPIRANVDDLGLLRKRDTCKRKHTQREKHPISKHAIPFRLTRPGTAPFRDVFPSVL
jgi:hypothetical protein